MVNDAPFGKYTIHSHCKSFIMAVVEGLFLMSRYYFVKSSRLVDSDVQQQRNNTSKPIKASVKAVSKQPSVSTLANLGIIVRDFAYESKLPPIKTIYCHPRQIQPAVMRTTLTPKHQLESTKRGEDNYFSQPSSQPETNPKKLERTSTELVILPTFDPTDNYFSRFSSRPETSRKILERTSTETVLIPPTPASDSDSTDVDSESESDNYDSDSEDGDSREPDKSEQVFGSLTG
jgi:hypothetical protein